MCVWVCFLVPPASVSRNVFWSRLVGECSVFCYIRPPSLRTCDFSWFFNTQQSPWKMLWNICLRPPFKQEAFPRQLSMVHDSQFLGDLGRLFHEGHFFSLFLFLHIFFIFTTSKYGTFYYFKMMNRLYACSMSLLLMRKNRFVVEQKSFPLLCQLLCLFLQPKKDFNGNQYHKTFFPLKINGSAILLSFNEPQIPTEH